LRQPTLLLGWFCFQEMLAALSQPGELHFTDSLRLPGSQAGIPDNDGELRNTACQRQQQEACI
jgi:hypothetical protein